MTTCGIFTFPSPSETWNHVECHPKIFKHSLVGQNFTLGHVAEENDHGSYVQGDGRGEEGDIWKSDKLIVNDDDVVGSNDS